MKNPDDIVVLFCPHCGGSRIEDRYEYFRATGQTDPRVVDPIYWCWDCKKELDEQEAESMVDRLDAKAEEASEGL